MKSRHMAGFFFGVPLQVRLFAKIFFKEQPFDVMILYR